jgi:hypothetical protein
LDVRLLVNGDQKIICGSGSGSDTYIEKDLQPGTDYVFILIDIGTSMRPVLASKTITTTK